MSFLAELKRRNVIKVAAAYIIVGWLIMQIGEVMSPALHLPDWVNSTLAFFIILGLPLALIFAWAFEMTPEGLKLEKDVDRSQSITHVTGRKLDLWVIALLVVALGYFAYDKFVLDPGRDAAEIQAAVETAQQVPAESSTTDNHSIAVLPFVNMSSETEQEYFSDGLSEELLNLLAKIPALQVAARTSSFSFKGQNLEIPEIARRLGVAHVLEGSVRKSGDQIRVTAQLIRADTGFHLWSDTFDRELDNIFAIQDEIAASVVDALKVTLLGEAPHAREADPEAYALFLEGRYHSLQKTKSSLERAIDLLKQSVEIDDSYAPAWAELAYAYTWYAGIGGMPIAEGNRVINQTIDRALTIDPDLAMTYFVRGIERVYYQFQWEAGLEDWKHARDLEPGNALVVSAVGTGERIMGRFDEAARIQAIALPMDPVMPENHSAVGNAAWLARRYEEAEAAYRKVLELSPEFAGGHLRLGRTLMGQGRFEEALGIIENEPSGVYRNTGLAMVYHLLGRDEKSRAQQAPLIEHHADTGAFQIAEIYAHRGELDDAFKWLDHAFEMHDSGLASTLGDPAFDSLLQDPRWAEFLQRLGLYEAWLEMPAKWGGPQE